MLLDITNCDDIFGSGFPSDVPISVPEKAHESCAMKNGRPYPLGATPTEEGVNFSIFSAHAKAMHLLLFDNEDATTASRVISFDPATNRTGHYWHVHLSRISPGQVYAYRADGLFAPDYGYRFDPNKVLLDPYGKAACTSRYSRTAASDRSDNEAYSMRSVVADLGSYDWENDRPLSLPFQASSRALAASERMHGRVTQLKGSKMRRILDYRREIRTRFSSRSIAQPQH